MGEGIEGGGEGREKVLEEFDEGGCLRFLILTPKQPHRTPSRQSLNHRQTSSSPCNFLMMRENQQRAQSRCCLSRQNCGNGRALASESEEEEGSDGVFREEGGGSV